MARRQSLCALGYRFSFGLTVLFEHRTGSRKPGFLGAFDLFIRDCAPGQQDGGLARRRGGDVLTEVAGYLRALPCLHLERVVHFREVEQSATLGTLPGRQSRSIEPAVDKIQIAVRIAEDAMAITPLALVQGLIFFCCRCLKHHMPHRAMMQIAQREERNPGTAVHDSSLEGMQPG